MFDADVETVRFNIAFDIHTLRFMHNAKPGPYTHPSPSVSLPAYYFGPMKY
jgi:hypothetical protein